MSVKKMDEMPEKKTESEILAKMGKKEQGRCQKESVVLKNGQSTDNGKHVTVRVQRIRKSHIKQKLILFSVLAACLVILAVFSDHLCPYDPYAQDLSQRPSGTQPSASHGNRYLWQGYAVPGDQRSKSQYFFHFYTGGCDFHFRYDCGIMLWLLWRNSGFCYDENF